MDRKTLLKKKYFNTSERWYARDSEELWSLILEENEEEFVEFENVFGICVDFLTCKQLLYLDEIFTKLKAIKS